MSVSCYVDIDGCRREGVVVQHQVVNSQTVQSEAIGPPRIMHSRKIKTANVADLVRRFESQIICKSRGAGPAVGQPFTQESVIGPCTVSREASYQMGRFASVTQNDALQYGPVTTNTVPVQWTGTSGKPPIPRSGFGTRTGAGRLTSGDARAKGHNWSTADSACSYEATNGHIMSNGALNNNGVRFLNATEKVNNGEEENIICINLADGDVSSDGGLQTLSLLIRRDCAIELKSVSLGGNIAVYNREGKEGYAITIEPIESPFLSKPASEAPQNAVQETEATISSVYKQMTDGVVNEVLETVCDATRERQFRRTGSQMTTGSAEEDYHIMASHTDQIVTSQPISQISDYQDMSGSRGFVPAGSPVGKAGSSAENLLPPFTRSEIERENTSPPETARGMDRAQLNGAGQSTTGALQSGGRSSGEGLGEAADKREKVFVLHRDGSANMSGTRAPSLNCEAEESAAGKTTPLGEPGSHAFSSQEEDHLLSSSSPSSISSSSSSLSSSSSSSASSTPRLKRKMPCEKHGEDALGSESPPNRSPLRRSDLSRIFEYRESAIVERISKFGCLTKVPQEEATEH